jgi:hypothetical protein
MKKTKREGMYELVKSINWRIKKVKGNMNTFNKKVDAVGISLNNLTTT